MVGWASMANRYHRFCHLPPLPETRTCDCTPEGREKDALQRTFQASQSAIAERKAKKRMGALILAMCGVGKPEEQVPADPFMGIMRSTGTTMNHPLQKLQGLGRVSSWSCKLMEQRPKPQIWF